MQKEVVLASYDDLSKNPNVFSQIEAKAYGDECIGQRLISIVDKELLEGYVSFDIVRVRSVQIQSTSPTRGQVVALCEHLGTKHRCIKPQSLKKREKKAS